MEFYSAVKSNGLLIGSTMGMNLKDIKFKEENQSQQVTNRKIHLHDVPEETKLQLVMVNRPSVARASG